MDENVIITNKKDDVSAVAGKDTDNPDKKLGNIINPVGLIEMLQK